MRLGRLLKLFHESIGNGHTGELFLTTMGTWLGVTTKTTEKGKVNIELILHPVNGRRRFVGEHLDEGWDDLVTGTLGSI